MRSDVEAVAIKYDDPVGSNAELIRCAITMSVPGRAAKATSACSSATGSNGPSFSGLVGLTSALDMAGDTTPARQTVVEMTEARDPTYVFMEPVVR